MTIAQRQLEEVGDDKSIYARLHVSCTGAQHLRCALVHRHDAAVARQAGISAHSHPQLIAPRVDIAPVMRNKSDATERKERKSMFAAKD